MLEIASLSAWAEEESLALSPERRPPVRRGERILSSLAKWFDVRKDTPELGIPAVHSLNL
jgi:hypothetical protein